MHTKPSPRSVNHIRSTHHSATESLLGCAASVLKATGHSEAGSCRILVHWRHKVHMSGVVLQFFFRYAATPSKEALREIRLCILATRGSTHPLLPRKSYRLVVLQEAIVTVKPALNHPLDDIRSRLHSLQQHGDDRTRGSTEVTRHTSAICMLKFQSFFGSRTTSLNCVIPCSRYLLLESLPETTMTGIRKRTPGIWSAIAAIYR